MTDDDGATDTVSRAVTVSAGAGTGEPAEKTFPSIAPEDGWVRESSEDSDIGGSRSTGGTGNKAIRMGDHQGVQQYKTILSFDTSSIPEGAVITGAVGADARGNTGQNPFNTHGTGYVDIKSGGFGGNAALQNGDFEAAASGSPRSRTRAAAAGVTRSIWAPGSHTSTRRGVRRCCCISQRTMTTIAAPTLPASTRPTTAIPHGIRV